MHARISYASILKTFGLSAVLASLLILTQANSAEESAKFEKIRDISPDQKFAVLISCSSEPEDPNHIDSSLITAVKLVSLPSKKIVMDLQNYDGSAAHVIWSPDSNWLAFSSSSGPRVTDTYVYHRSGDDFGEVKTENLQVDVKGDVRNSLSTGEGHESYASLSVPGRRKVVATTDQRRFWARQRSDFLARWRNDRFHA